ncbi:NlpC/P60 family protein [Pseudonocardia sp. WMMC193]|uniref:NlpC/P60 family protein n=1 Tax=Pseudonocardia sp. WMMC193 TaxID=2911965 RepID=UPI0035ABFB19
MAAALGLMLVALAPAGDHRPASGVVSAAADVTAEVPLSMIGSVTVVGTDPVVGPPVAVQLTVDVPPATVEFTTALPDQRAAVAIRTAMAQLGLPYVWGGDGPGAGDAGFDCSGLTTFSYAAAGVGLPRTAHTQYYRGPHVPAGAALQPGDLVFYGTAARVHHVGMYLGNGRMVNAPTFGKPVQTAYYRWVGDDYLGATRPTASGTSTGVLPVLPEPAPTAPAPNPVFQAPAAPAPVEVPDPQAPQPAEAQSAAGAVTESSAAVANGLVPAPETVAVGETPPSSPPAVGTTTTTDATATAVPPTTEAPGGAPTAAVPQTSTTPPTTPPTGTVPPKTVPPKTEPPKAVPPKTEPLTSTPPSTAPAAPPTSATATPPPAEEKPAVRVSITVGGVTTDLAQVRKGADGLPARVGIAGRFVRLSSAAGAVGSAVTLTLSDGTTKSYTVASRQTGTAAEAAATGGSLVLVVPGDGDSWTVVVAS